MDAQSDVVKKVDGDVVITFTRMPADTVSAARDAYATIKSPTSDTDQAAARARLADIAATAHERRWSWRALEDAIDVPGLRGAWLDSLSRQHATGEPVDDVEIPWFEMVRTRGGKVQRRTPIPLTNAERDEISTLAVTARLVRGNTPLDHQHRKDSVRLSELLANAHDRGVTWQDLAGASQMSIPAVRARVARHGHRVLPPSQRKLAYRGVTIGKGSEK